MKIFFLYLVLWLYNKLIQHTWELVVLKYRNCSIANFPEELSAVNTVKCVLNIIYETGLIFNEPSHAVANPKIFSLYCYTIGHAKQTKLKILLK